MILVAMRRLLVALAASAFLGTAAAAKTVEVTVDGLALDATTGSPVVRLVERGKTGRELPIWIGPFEAQAIAIEMQGVPPPRPLTHDLMKQLVERLGGRLVRVEITDLRDATYFATLHIEAEGHDVPVDARPSDAIALALRLHGPILVEEGVFAKAAAAQPSPGLAHVWGLTVQDLTPDIASFFSASDARGVLVADVAARAPARDLARGDIIVALDDEPVGTVEQLTTLAGARTGADPVRLEVRRGNRTVRVHFKAE